MTHNNSIKTAILIARENTDRDHDLTALMLNKNITLIRVESGTEALSVLQTNPAIALAMINADLPGLNGFDTSFEIRKLAPGLPIILFLNYVNIESIRLSTLTGCTRMLQNPVDPYELETIVEHCIQKPKAETEAPVETEYINN